MHLAQSCPVVDLGVKTTLTTIKNKQLGITSFSSRWSLQLTPFYVTAEKICQWLSPPDSSGNYNAACEILKSQTDTCFWFLKGDKFSQWLVNPSFLWIKGKSKLSSNKLNWAIS